MTPPHQRSEQEARRLIGGRMLQNGCDVDEIHRYYRRQVVMVWDNLSAHHAAASFFDDEHPDWFDFYFFPTCVPESNPLASCRHQTKNAAMANFTPKNKDESAHKLFQSTDHGSSDKRFFASLFKHAGLKI